MIKITKRELFIMIAGVLLTLLGYLLVKPLLPPTTVCVCCDVRGVEFNINLFGLGPDCVSQCAPPKYFVNELTLDALLFKIKSFRANGQFPLLSCASLSDDDLLFNNSLWVVD